MHLIKIIILIFVLALQLTTFCLGASKFIYATKLKDRIEYLIIALSGLVGFIFLTNPVMYLI